LEEKINLRTRQLEEENAELTNFAYVTSHDLKAPLRAISQLSAWIAEDYAPVLDQEGRDKLALLTDRAKHMHNLIDDILQYSRVGRVTEKVVVVDLNALVLDTIAVLDPPPAIQVQIEGKLPVVKVEATNIAQVFQNLLGNAIKYMDKPQGWIKIGCKSEQGEWVFSVADNGPGIEGKYFERIFQVFQTLGTRKGVDSTGIGLAIVKRIVEKWGGSVWVESEPGKGSVFYFTLPTQPD
jgi:light-regulated signal transduction histidine kinase (bacteriophytochrome)